MLIFVKSACGFPMQRSPFINAVFWGKTDLASYFIEKGATISGQEFNALISLGHE